MCKRNARQTPEEPPVRCHTGLPIAIPLHSALRRFANPFRVAGFGRADLTKFPWISPVTCEGDTAVLLASCEECELLNLLSVLSNVLISMMSAQEGSKGVATMAD